MSKRDRQGVRTASDIERKYDLGAIGKQSGQINKQSSQVSQLSQALSQFVSATNVEISNLKNQISNLSNQISNQDAVWQKAYPVGSIYMSTGSTSPAELFGFGEWEQIKDTFLLSAGDTYEGGAVGGEATHTLTLEEMPNHTHKFAYFSTGATAAKTMLAINGDSFESGTSEWRTTTQDFVIDSGGGEAHNNMPPYIVVYMWKRTK